MRHVQSYWQPEAPPDPEPQFGHLEADVVVVGAGLAGLSAARRLLAADPGLDLLVLDAHRAGFGGSGRNAGVVEAPLLMPIWLYPGTLPTAERRWALSCLHRRALEEIERVSAQGSNADVLPSRAIVSAASGFGAELLRNAARELDAAGLPCGWLGAEAVAAACLARGKGALDLPGFAVNPIALVRQTAEAVQRCGGRILEGVRITGIAAKGQGRVELHTATGRLSARAAVICTGPWTKDLQVSRRPSIHPFVTCMVATEPLDDAVIAALGGESCSVAEIFSMTYRRVHGRRLLFGGAEKMLRRADAAVEPDGTRVATLLRQLASSLPSLADTSLAFSWCGPVSAHSPPAPIVRPHPAEPAIVFSAGFQTFVPALLSGTMVQGLVLGRTHVDDEAERLRRAYAATRMPWFGGPATAVRALWRSFTAARP